MGVQIFEVNDVLWGENVTMTVTIGVEYFLLFHILDIFTPASFATNERSPKDEFIIYLYREKELLTIHKSI